MDSSVRLRYFGKYLTTTDANGTVITNSYDNANRVTSRTYSNEPSGVSTPAVSFKYDGKGLDTQQSPNYAKGKLTSVNNTISLTRYLTFDNLGRLASSEQKTPVGTETINDATPRVSYYEYNLSGGLVKETYPSGREVRNDFESDGDLSRIYGKANAGATERTYANSFSYTAAGAVAQLKFGNGRWENAKFNDRLQLTELGLGNSSTDSSLWKVNYEYGEIQTNGTVDMAKNTGNIAKQTLSFSGLMHPLVQTYKYDSLARLTEAKETENGTQNWIQNFGYDRFGNRTSFSQQVGQSSVTQTPTVDGNTNRFFLNQGFSYDKNGNGGFNAPAGTADLALKPMFKPSIVRGYLRDADAEYKLFEFLGGAIKNANAKGTVFIHTERTPCTSCGGEIVSQFLSRFPNIKVTIKTGGKTGKIP